jgi:hypothetical protein
MSDWIHALPVALMALVIFGTTYLVTAAICLAVFRLSTGSRAAAFKAVSPGLLPVLGVIFGLLIAFLAAQVWGDVERAKSAVNHEASALRGVVLLAAEFPGEPEARLRKLVSRHVRDARTIEWPAMARHQATLTMIPRSLAEALAVAVALPASTPGAAAAQREIITALENVLEARRQRILVSHAGVDWVKWAALIIQACCTLTAIAMVHSDNRLTVGIATGLFATAAAVCLVLIVSHDRPFVGQLAVSPDVLLQVQPDTTIGP